MSFDYHRAMTDAVVAVPNVHPERLVWIMNETHRARYRHFLEHEMGVDPDDRYLAHEIVERKSQPTNFSAVLPP